MGVQLPLGAPISEDGGMEDALASELSENSREGSSPSPRTISDRDIEIVGKYICTVIERIPAVDPLDGSSNWWAYYELAKRLVTLRPDLPARIHAAIATASQLKTDIRGLYQLLKESPSGGAVDTPA